MCSDAATTLALAGGAVGSLAVVGRAAAAAMKFVWAVVSFV
jgi:hypothetical protein